MTEEIHTERNPIANIADIGDPIATIILTNNIQ